MFRMRILQWGAAPASAAVVLAIANLAAPPSLVGQDAPPGIPTGVVSGVKVGGSSNMHLIAHVPLGGYFRVADGDIEQELSRPYAYVAQTRDQIGFDDHRSPRPAQRQGPLPVAHRERRRCTRGWARCGRSTSSSMAATTSRSAPSSARARRTPTWARSSSTSRACPTPRRSKRSRAFGSPSMPGGFHNLFPYKHSDGRVLLFTTTTGAQANVYDMDKLLHGDKDQGLHRHDPGPARAAMCVREVAARDSARVRLRLGYHDFYVGYDPATRQDKFYGAGGGGYYVYDVTNIGSEEPEAAHLDRRPGRRLWGHTFTPTPDGDVRRDRDRVSVGAAPDLRSAARARGEGAGDHAAGLGVELGLERSAAQPRGPLAVRLRLRLRGRPRGVQHAGPGASADRRLVLHLRVRARNRLRRSARTGSGTASTTARSGSWCATPMASS